MELEKLSELERKIGYTFREKNLLIEALTHPSYPGDGHNVPDYERLEFLGDAVVELAVTRFLFEKFKEKDEGELTKMRAAIVNRDALAEDALKIGLGEYIILGEGEKRSGGKNRTSILSCAMEAVVGAVFVDAGYEKAEEIVKKFILDEYEKKLSRIKDDKNFKGILQEYVQKKFHTLPIYSVVKEDGPPHQRTFEVEVRIKNKTMGKGKGKSLKEAERKAAQEALEKLKEEK